MKYQAFVRAAAGVLATAILGTGAALAQGSTPTPPTMTDTAPLPAGDRESSGAVILMDQPVLAQRQAMLAWQERSPVDTTALGAGPARTFRRAEAMQQMRKRRAEERLRELNGTPN